MSTVRNIAADLQAGRIKSRDLVEQSLARISDPAGEGARVFISVNAERARAEADAVDRKRSLGESVPYFAGIPFGVKDLFDVAGEITTAGSRLLSNAAPAIADSDAVGCMCKAGFIVVGRTNMTEFAYSGVGLNPHYGTPLSVYGRHVGHIPGGSSSGSAVAVADAMVPVALGTDSGGSCRIPATFNGIVGFKPSAARISRRGVYPLSTSFDSVGPLARSVDCCAVVDAILAGDVIPEADVAGSGKSLRIGVLQEVVLDGLDSAVAGDFSAALERLSRAGHQVEALHFPALAELPSLLAHGGIMAAEAYAHHASMIAAHEAAYDPRVVSRFKLGAAISAEALLRLRERRQALIASFTEAARGYDAVMCPTVPVAPPRVSELAEDTEYRRINGLCLRNTYAFNFLDGCAISLPMHRHGQVPTGLMLALPNGGDSRLFSTAGVVEAALASA